MSKATSGKPIHTEQTGEPFIIAGSFVPAGTGTTAPTGVRGSGFTVTQTASGVFLVALKNVYKETISFQATADVASETTDVYAQAGDVTAATALVGEKRVIRTMTAATPTNISGDSAPRVHFVWVVRKY
jgi:hypothetical protein